MPLLYYYFADESEDGSDIAEPYGGIDGGDTFMDSYSDSLSKELNASTLKRSFIRASKQANKDEEVSVFTILCSVI